LKIKDHHKLGVLLLMSQRLGGLAFAKGSQVFRSLDK